jgi:hypothetical protein
VVLAKGPNRWILIEEAELPLEEFRAFHLPALEQSAARHNLIIGLLERYSTDHSSELRTWSLGGPGECAVQTPGFPVVLGELDAGQSVELAEQLVGGDWSGIVGPDQTARWLSDRTVELGAKFSGSMPQKIHALQSSPRYPGAQGQARAATSDDLDLLKDWARKFYSEALAHLPTPSAEHLEAMVKGDSFYL